MGQAREAPARHYGKKTDNDRGAWLMVDWDRTAIRVRAVCDYLLEQGGTANCNDAISHAGLLLPPQGDELRRHANGREGWANYIRWKSRSMSIAGWLHRRGGTWTITEDGRQALEAFPDPLEFSAAIDRRRGELWAAREDEVRRAWLVRGTSVRGTDLVPDWIGEGYCSIAATQLRELAEDVNRTDLKAIAAEDYEHLGKAERKSKVGDIVAFVIKMSPGDVVVTTDGAQVYVGDVIGDWEQTTSEGGRANLRRDVEWRNADAPVPFDALVDPLPARLQASGTVVELTADLDLIESILAPDAELADESDIGFTRAPRHAHLPEPSAGLAADLLVDADWLTEVRDLLDERRQVIFYGPPGTGKTWIARKLAADLVGPEQVKLVQFHPAYTYEDFFEGYRPAGGDTDGTISFELKAGPLRQLVNRAREHPDQAFVLIIDEINRANLAKVFGELYFLLEYRDQAVDLLYGDDEQGFTLPKNLYVIGTMNTADRSIALVDQAMRRRFAFVALNPDEEPTRSLLARWSARHDLDGTAARLLARLNAVIEDPDFRIGPSYFMTSTAPDAFSRKRLERIWRTSIEPLLQEHHYGQWDAVRGDYDLDRLLGGE